MPLSSKNAEPALRSLKLLEAGYDRIMGAQEPPPPDLRCDFCGNRESDGRSMVAGPGVYICDKCVELAIKVLEERGVPVSR